MHHSFFLLIIPHPSFLGIQLTLPIREALESEGIAKLHKLLLSGRMGFYHTFYDRLLEHGETPEAVQAAREKFNQNPDKGLVVPDPKLIRDPYLINICKNLKHCKLIRIVADKRRNLLNEKQLITSIPFGFGFPGCQ